MKYIGDEGAFLSELSSVFSKNGLAALLNKERAEQFLFLAEHMLEENEKYNLTAITEPSRIITEHFADCALLSPHLPKGASLADVGCGAGFPTLPLAIVRPDLKILAMDSTAKRVRYVEDTAKALCLPHVTTLTKRAEEAGRDPSLRERFDVVTARAVANLRVLCELCLPLVRVGGQMLAMKGKNAASEHREAKRCIAILGAKSQAPVQKQLLSLADETSERPLVILDKVTRTPDAYPRTYAQICKKPL